jgi:hypothetical protein
VRATGVRALVAVGLALSLGPQAAAASLFAPPAHPDPRESTAGPLDVRSVSFGQRELRFVMTVRTWGRWRVSALARGRALCVVVTGGDVCIGRRARLHFTSSPGTRAQLLPARVNRPDAFSVRASFSRRLLPVADGRLAWSFEERAPCPAGQCVVDRAPEAGSFRTRAALLGEPACFGAAARDSGRPCRNRALDRVAYPRPEAAYVWLNSRCVPLPRSGAFRPCGFGVPPSAARATVLLTGDSHAVHWRAALEVVAQARRWRGVDVTRPGCPFSVQIPSSPSLGPAACAQLHRQTLDWLAAHPRVKTLFVSDWAEPPGGPQGGIGGYGGGPSAFGAMLDMVPSSVTAIYVLRDIPATTLGSMNCVDARLIRHRRLRGACGAPRSRVLTADPGAAAAAGRPRVHVIDLTRVFCGGSTCYPVIGGAYVYKDDNHMNAAFGVTLGPHLLRVLDGR